MGFQKGQSGNPAAQFKPGQSGNPEGKKPGVRSWSTIVQNLLADEELPEKLLKKKPGWWDAVENKNAANLIVIAMVTRAIGGDDKAATWLRKTGYGDKLDLMSGDRPLRAIQVYDMRLGVPADPEPEAKPKRKRKPAAKKKPAKKAPAKAKRDIKPSK